MSSISLREVSFDEVSLARVFGFSCNRAWAYVSFFSISLFYMPESFSNPVESSLYLWSSAFLALSLVAVAILHRRVEQMLSSRNGALIGAVLTSAGSALIPFLGSGSPLSIGGTSLLMISAILTGIGSCLMLISWGISYSKLNLDSLILESSAAYLTSVLMYVVISMTLPVAQYAFAIVLPLLSGWLCKMSESKTTPGSYCDVSFGDKRSCFLKIAIGIVLFGLVTGFTRDLQPPTAQVDARSGYAWTVFAATTVVIVCFLVANRRRASLNVNMLFRPVLIIMLVGILLIPLFGASSLAPAALVKSGYTCFELLIWIILGNISRTQKISPVLAFAFGRALIAGSGFLGSTIAYLVMPHLMYNLAESFFISVVLAIILIVLCNSILTTENFSKLWEEKEPEKLPFRERCFAVFEEKGLSPRQQEIAFLIACGHDAAYISEKLYISVGTINSHRNRIYKRLDIHSRQELLNMVSESGDGSMSE